jgi:hypothetical protein
MPVKVLGSLSTNWVLPLSFVYASVSCSNLTFAHIVIARRLTNVAKSVAINMAFDFLPKLTQNKREERKFYDFKTISIPARTTAY